MNGVRDATQAFFSGINARDMTALANVLDDAVLLQYPGLRTVEGKGPTLVFFRQLLSRFERLTFNEVDIVTDATRACVFWVNEGLRKDGTDYRNSGVTLVAEARGKIVLLSDYFKFDPRGAF